MIAIAGSGMYVAALEGETGRIRQGGVGADVSTHWSALAV